MSTDVPRPSSKKIVLVVDDKPTVRSYVRAVLERNGFASILEADNGADALALVRKAGHALGLIISDLSMPEMDGASFARAVRQLFPSLPIIYISGYTDPDEVLDDHGLCTFLPKPFLPHTLMDTVRTVLAKAAFP